VRAFTTSSSRAAAGSVGISSLGSSGVGDSPVLSRSVATVVDGEQEATSAGATTASCALSVQIYKIQDANIVETGGEP